VGDNARYWVGKSFFKNKNNKNNKNILIIIIFKKTGGGRGENKVPKKRI
jgi:hypothetical protein